MGDGAELVLIKCRFEDDATELEVDESFPYQVARSAIHCVPPADGDPVCLQDLERHLKSEFGYLGEVVIRYQAAAQCRL